MPNMIITCHGLMDKTGWPEGEWTTEPDRVYWIQEPTGTHCVINRASGGHLCGYVRVPIEHPFYGMSYDSLPKLNVQREISYTESALLFHSQVTVPDFDLAYMSWWLGFACDRSDDYSPKLARYPGEIYRNIHYVTHICKMLAYRLKAEEVKEIK